jgi:ribA/ribD-fused uncharacterized protein
MKQRIEFYRPRDQPHGVFSNFLRNYPITVGGKVWPSSEHYFQAQKHVGTFREDEIRMAPTPKDAARLGRDVNVSIRTDWEHVKNDEMMIALRAKFTQYPDLYAILLDTGDAELVEHTVNDSYWGDGGDGSGQNWLGKLLMQLRD